MSSLKQERAYGTCTQEEVSHFRERKLQTLRTWWSQITDEDWIRIAGQREVLHRVVQEKYGVTPEIAQQDIERCFRALNKIC